MKTKYKKIIAEIIDEMLTIDDEMLSVHIMKTYNIKPEEYVKIRTWLDNKIRQILEYN